MDCMQAAITNADNIARSCGYQLIGGSVLLGLSLFATVSLYTPFNEAELKKAKIADGVDPNLIDNETGEAIKIEFEDFNYSSAAKL